MNSSAAATAPLPYPAKATAAAKPDVTNAALRTLSRWPPIIPMWPKATQLTTPITGIQIAGMARAARAIAAFPNATMPARTAMATGTMVKAFCPVTCIMSPTKSGDPARMVPMRSRPSTVTAPARQA